MGDEDVRSSYILDDVWWEWVGASLFVMLAAASSATAAAATATDAAAVALVLLMLIFALHDDGTIIEGVGAIVFFLWDTAAAFVSNCGVKSKNVDHWSRGQ